MFTVDSRKIFITVNGSRHEVHRVNNFPDSVLVELQSGKFFMQYWKLAEKRGEKKKRAFREYKDVYSLFRGIRHAIDSAKKKRIPTLEQMQSFAQEINFELDAADKSDKPAVKRAQAEMLEILDGLKFVQSIELKEAREKLQLATTLRDRLNRLNISASCARLVAVRRRFSERIENIIGWLVYYAKWAEGISAFLDFHELYLPRFHGRLCQLIDEGIIKNSKMGKTELTCRYLNGMREKILQLQMFSGWRLWALQCDKDLKEAGRLVLIQENEQAIAVLKKIENAISLKVIQYEIHYALFEIGFDQAADNFEPKKHLKALEGILECLNAIDETGFRNPVAGSVSNLLASAKAMLINGDSATFLKEGKAAYRAAYRIL